MLFNSYEFILAFLPVTLAVTYALAARGWRRACAGWVIAASLFFYGWWNPAYLPLILGSIGGNFVVASLIGVLGRRAAFAVLTAGITANLVALGYFKYAGFIAANLGPLAGRDWRLEGIVLPLAISFFTFQQITFLVDAWRMRGLRTGFVEYVLCVTFFPHLIAGPIIHYGEFAPQFARPGAFRFQDHRFAVGLGIFIIGLFKKAVLADGLAGYATPVFDAAAAGHAPGLLAAWRAAFAYTFQLYFDFSGYSDMAIGLARMFGVRLPLNFFSPYRAVSIIEFWRRWHMTLSRFLRDYVYIPLGGNRHGPARRHLNLLVTMLLGGLWHGAGWTFVIWGGLHGLFLGVNHAWRAARQRWFPGVAAGPAGQAAAWALTFLSVVVAWVFFRADDLAAALTMLRSMTGLDGLGSAARLPRDLAALIALVAATLLLPNTIQFMARYRPALRPYRDVAAFRPVRLRWRPTLAWSAALAALAVIAVFQLGENTEFIYYNF